MLSGFLLPAFLVLCSGAIATAEEPAEKFLNALRDNGYYDVALDYLTEIESSDRISESFRIALPFEKAETLIASTARTKDLELIEARLDEAEKLLTQFAANSTTDEAKAKAQRYRGNLHVGRAKLYRSRSGSDRLTAAEKDELTANTRSALSAAGEAYALAREFQREAAQGVRIDPGDGGKSIAERKRLQGHYTQIRLRQPIVVEQLADTYPDDSPERKKLLEEASASYLDLLDAYRNYMAGLESGFFAARCQFKLGKPDEALVTLKPLLQLSDSATVKKLKQRSLVLATQCWSSREPYPFEDVVRDAQPVVASLSKAELREYDWLVVQLELARASRLLAAKMKADGGPAAEIGALNSSAAKMARNVSRSSPELREQANQLIAAWNLSAEEAAPDEGPPKTFADALVVVESDIPTLESLLNTFTQARIKFARAPDVEAKAMAEQEMENAQLEIDEAVNATLERVDYAFRLSDDKTEREGVNKLRYYQTYCYYVAGNHVESALIGSYLFRSFPKVNYSRQAASLAIRSYDSILKTEGSHDYEFAEFVALANGMISSWPGSRDAGTAASAMCSQYVSRGDLAKGEEYFEKIPDSYSSRDTLAMQIGQRVWYKYANEKKKLPADEADALVVSAKKYLMDGVTNANPSKLTYSTALSAQFLVNAHLASGDVDLAIEQLEGDTTAIAPLSLVAGKHPAIMNHSRRDLYIRETYKAAVNCYLAKLREGGDQKKWIDKASGITAAMQELADTSPEAAKQVAATYYRIGSQLKMDFDAMPSADAKQKFSAVLAPFLSAIEADSSDPKIILWVGSTLLDVASSLSTGGNDEAARPLYANAQKALDHAGELGMSNDMQMKWQRARALRGSGQFESANDQFIELIKEKNSYNVQFDAAENLHAWAKSTRRAGGFAESLGGAGKFTDPKTKKERNLIWGWKALSGATKDKPEYLDIHVNSMFFLIESRLEYGLIKGSDKAIKAAGRDLEKYREAQPATSQAGFKQRFDELQQRIDNAKK